MGFQEGLLRVVGQFADGRFGAVRRDPSSLYRKVQAYYPAVQIYSATKAFDRVAKPRAPG